MTTLYLSPRYRPRPLVAVAALMVALTEATTRAQWWATLVDECADGRTEGRA
jgi:hypothetical protein